MSDNIIAAIIGAISGSVVTGIGAFIAPWVNWGIEKRRDKMNRRRDLINNARIHLAGRTLNREALRLSPAYAALRAHLTAEVVNNIEQRDRSGGEETIQGTIMMELAELERKWKLI